ncbi:unnamed protein product [Urochloa decumbens]|uniref:Gnk2-homologous domain-containing protein n=1 Tax=Urochloa decumbens TaxID=240449 RepID=A0ABC8XXF7_9POAL
MAFPTKLSVGGLPSLIVLVLVLLQLQPGITLKLEPAGTSTHFPPLLDCAPAPDPAAPSNPNNDAAFRANVLSLLGALPSTAAAAPTGSAATRSDGAARDRAFARGACFGLGAPRGPSPGDCLSCLSAAASDVAAGCDAAPRRAGVWRAGCFLSYADTNAPTAREDAFRGWFYDDDRDDGGGAPTAALGSECTANRTARVVPALKDMKLLSMVHGDAVVVVGYGCYLRVPLFQLAQDPWWMGIFYAIDVIAVVLMEVGGLLFCIDIARQFNPA